MLPCLISVLLTFLIKVVLKFEKKKSVAKRLIGRKCEGGFMAIINETVWGTKVTYGTVTYYKHKVFVYWLAHMFPPNAIFRSH